jgi:hypothetical protein
MTALTQPFNQPLTEKADEHFHTLIDSSVTIFAGTLAMNNAGVIQVYTAAGFAAGATLLGFPTSNVANNTAAQLTIPRTMFRRGCPMIVAPKSGDAPTLANVGGTVYLKDNFTVGATNSGTDQACQLLEVINASQLKIKLP